MNDQARTGSLSAIRWLFGIAALYDGVLGVGFFLLPRWIFDVAAVTPPNHFGYVRFPAALLVVFAAMFLAVALDPRGQRNLIPFGAMLKVSYCLVTFYYWARSDVPTMWKPFAIIDLVFLASFIWAYLALRPARPASSA